MKREEWRRLRGCARKIRYESPVQAIAAIIGMWANFPDEEPADMDEYECRYCGGWHVGHRGEDPAAVKRRRNRRHFHRWLRKKQRRLGTD